MAAPPLSPAPSQSTAAAALAETADGTPALAQGPVSVQTTTPHRIGRFVILRLLGQGGMGVVYSAYDEQLDRKVAVKVLHQTESVSSEQRARVFREAQAMARVSHPNVVQVYEVGELAGQVFIAMEYIEGTSLTTWQSAEQRTWEEVLQIYLAAGQGLLDAHQVGLVHRDFKPDNVLLGKDGRPRVADFGLAHGESQAEALASPDPGLSRPLLATPLTQLGAIVGTPAYMSPEQYKGERGDARSDQFSFCAALYEALYRQLPFAGEELEVLAANVLSGKVRPAPSGLHVPVAVHQALLRGLSVDPAQRFQSMAELLSALDIDPQHSPAGAPRARRLLTGVLMVIVILRTAYFTIFQRDSALRIRDMLGSAVFICVAVLVATWVMRRTLKQNRFQRMLVGQLVLMTFQLVGTRLIGMAVGLTVQQLVAVDMIAAAIWCAMVTWSQLPGFWVTIPYCIAASVAVTLFPSTTRLMVGAGYPLLAFVFFATWNRSAKQQARTTASKSP